MFFFFFFFFFDGGEGLKAVRALVKLNPCNNGIKGLKSNKNQINY